MGKRARFFRRAIETRDYRRVCVVATEGKETESQYFKLRIFSQENQVVHVKLVRSDTKSSPSAVLGRMRKYIKEYGIKGKDEAWLVIDTDNWTKTKIQELFSWSQGSPNYHLAVSNPKFEYWLLLHFEEGNGVANKTECLTRLESCIPDYDKANLPLNKFTAINVRLAVARAKIKDNPPCTTWPRTTGTTVYKLVESILRF